MKELSNHAKVAKLCRAYLKSLGIKGRCTSQSYSMGDNVNVEVEDLSPSMTQKLIEEFAKYQYGHFDGMTDSYNYDNCDSSIPQTKYLFVNNSYSDIMRNKAIEHLIRVHNVYDDTTAQECFGRWYDNVIHGVLTGVYDKQEFWGEE